MRATWEKISWATPGAAVGAAGAVVWLAEVGRGDGLAFVGWVGLLLIFATIAGIVAGVRGQSVLPAVFFLVAVVAIEMVALGFGAGFAGLVPAAELAAICAAWTLLWSSAAWALSRFGPAIAGGVPLLAAMLLMAAPVIALPAVHATPSGSPRQHLLVEAIAHSCPMLACIAAVQPHIRIEWAELPGMYAMSGLGQEVPMELPEGWTSAAIYGGGAMLLACVGLLLNRKQSELRP